MDDFQRLVILDETRDNTFAFNGHPEIGYNINENLEDDDGHSATNGKPVAIIQCLFAFQIYIQEEDDDNYVGESSIDDLPPKDLGVPSVVVMGSLTLSMECFFQSRQIQFEVCGEEERNFSNNLIHRKVPEPYQTLITAEMEGMKKDCGNDDESYLTKEIEDKTCHGKGMWVIGKLKFCLLDDPYSKLTPG
ncbi:PREDICTED: uncharacterized protein LOC109581815 isoform X1 [Amphimedon queenslandica]|uniref:Uncharacterized protein n=1 Tax=Amphimedon queenslandica TaxID=400682 RepID=A0AAN0J4W2_AMPQE|nr:PREDICTED: uncharacterized protein LOC109581815 isoform X1 [Amphimedon queenslandica]|eukprot:XP_019851781.1 PREDICTED: uncharacterized protein LOC109581815 isoform X1 [Amphimedon queenslandica]